MRSLALAAVLLAAGLAGPAAAQYYGPGYGPPPPGYPPPPPPGYGPPPGYPPPGYGYRQGYGPPQQPRGQYTQTCITSRGVCPIGAFVPRGAPCGCNIPGFGYKRGAAG